MNATSTRTTLVTLAITAALAIPPFGLSTAHAAPDVHVAGITAVGFNPQPDPPSFSRHHDVAIGNPNDRPGASVGLGGPDTAPVQHN